MYIHEAYSVLEATESTVNDLLEAQEVLAVEKGYLLAIATHNLKLENCDSTELQGKIWRLAFYIKVLNIKINNKFNQLGD